MTIPGLHIAFDAKRYFFNQSGLGVYSRSLIEALHQHAPEVNITLAVSHLPKSMSADQLKTQGLDIMMNTGMYPNWYWRSFQIASVLLHSNISIYHGLSHELPFGIDKTKVKSVVTVHDLLFLDFPQDYAWIDRQFYYHKIKYALKVADRIIAISSYTKQRILHHFDINPDHIVVIPPIAESTFWLDDSNQMNTDTLQAYNLPQNYFLFVGSWGMRKNLNAVINALELLNWPLPLIVLGKQGKLLEGNYSQHKVHYLSGLGRNELKLLYKKSSGLLFPSIAEGFGLPVLEALICGTPVLTSQESAMSEFAGEFAILVNPHQIEDIANGILKLNEFFPDRQKVQKLIKRFSPENTSMQLYQLYQSII